MDSENKIDTLETENLQNENVPEVNVPIIETIPENNIEQTPNNVIQEPIETLDVIPTLESGVVPTLESNEPFQDNFSSVPVPPVFQTEEPKKKLDNKKLLFFLAIGILIAGVGFGIYYFLIMAKNNAPVSSINVKEVKLELGNQLSENIDDYAIIKGYNKESCTLNTNQVLSTKVGAYKFYIKCEEQIVNGTIIIDDTIKPEAITNDVTVLPNATITAKDFIDSCIDASKCTYKFKNDAAISSSLVKLGTYDVEILVSDEYNNESTVKAKLTISNDAPVKYFTCTSKEENIDSIHAKLTKNYKIGVSINNKIYNITKISNFKFDKVEDYLTIKNNYNESVGINGIIGKSIFNQSTKLINVKTNITLDELSTDLNFNTIDDANVIQMYFAMSNYTCK